MRCLLTPNTILLLTGAILTLKIITDGDHSLSSNLGFLSGVRSVCGLCAVFVRSLCGLCAVCVRSVCGLYVVCMRSCAAHVRRVGERRRCSLLTYTLVNLQCYLMGEDILIVTEAQSVVGPRRKRRR
jgi:hypothetical protein